MANMLIGWPNIFTTGTITAAGAVANMPATNVGNDQGSSDQGWQYAGTTTWLQLDAGSNITWRMFGLFRTNLTVLATTRWRVWTGTNTALTPVYDSGTVSAGIVAGVRQTVTIAPSNVTGQTVRVDIVDGTNTDNFVNVPLAFAGPAWQPLRNMSYASVPGRTRQATKAGLRAGGDVIRVDWLKRTYDLSMAGVKASELWTQLDSVDLWAQQGNNVLFVPDPSSTTLNREAIFGEWEPQSGYTYPYQATDARGYRTMITERL